MNHMENEDIVINILKIKSVEVFYCCNWLMCLNHCKQNMNLTPPNMGMRQSFQTS